ncbi:LOW QUALITY PROTEIN: Bardet-Biedl syndrome 10 protein [Pristis pectinata]|uniref:LOW QUALITY PROTEIN: Bardet-Biedl syndrome 10 protein n=1 Tax=Pristis pectinata TaxID=685728 RepID=UPI00223D08DC|nr:LOW QUALITY PROTEIN: Bardet-Biedl syndrome 10 protein [Pristis pectinata]
MECEGALDIGNLVHIAETLENIVSPCLGPLGGQVLFTRATGDILITRDGGTILECLLLDHPAARWMASSALCHRRRTGDGAKSFLLLLAALLRAARAEGAGGRRRLARGLARLERDVLPGLLCRRLGPYCGSALGPGPGSGPGREAVARVLSAYLSGRVSVAAGRPARPPGPRAAVAAGRRRAGPGRPAVRPEPDRAAAGGGRAAGDPQPGAGGAALGRGLAVGGRPGPTNALLLTGSLAPALTEPGLTLRPGSAPALAQARARAAASLERTVARLQGLGVGLLLSGPQQPACALQAAEAGGLALVHGLADEELELVRRLTGAEPVRRADQARAADAVPARFVRPLGPGPGPQLLVGLAGRHGLRPHCLVLCAPVLGLAQQHRDTVAGACRLLGLLLPEPGEPGSRVEGPDPGALAWEGTEPGAPGWEGPDPGVPVKEGPNPGVPVRERESRDPAGSEGPDPGSRREGPNAGVPGIGREGDDPGTPEWEREGSSAGVPGMGTDGQCARDLGKAEGQTEGQNGLDVERTQSSEPRGTQGNPSGAFPSPLTPSHSPQPPSTHPAWCGGCDPGEWQLPAGCVLPAGGAFEFLMHHYLQCESDRQQDDTRLACRVVAQALLNIPHHLQRGPSPGRDLLRAHADFARQLREGQVVSVDRGPLEVVAAKGQLVISALQCLRSLLSVDRAVAVRGRLRNEAQAESEDSE